MTQTENTFSQIIIAPLKRLKLKVRVVVMFNNHLQHEI